MAGPCPNHPGVEATHQCAGCRRVFCVNCVVEMGGFIYCGTCKNRAVRDAQTLIEYKLPGEALTYAIVGIFCCVLLQPFAIYKGMKALGEIKANPQLPGHGKAVAAVTIGIIVLALNVLGFIANVILKSQVR